MISMLATASDPHCSRRVELRRHSAQFRYARAHEHRARGRQAPAVTADLFVVVEQESTGQHRFTLLEPNGPEWLRRVAAIYRDLRTQTAAPLTDDLLDGLDFDVTHVRRRMRETQVPSRDNGSPRQLSVARSDLAEVALAAAGEELRQYVYGYRSTRDREVVNLPGRGIDQIGVMQGRVGGRDVVYLSLGEAKLSSENRVPPRVVDTGDECLDQQHRKHFEDHAGTSAKIWEAGRKAHDRTTARLMMQAAHLWDIQKRESLVVRCTSMLVRPSRGTAADAGPFTSSPDDYAPGEVDFMMLRLDNDDVEEVIDAFIELAVSDEEVA